MSCLSLNTLNHSARAPDSLTSGAPAVIGCLVVTLAQLLPYAAPDSFGVVLLVLTTLALVLWRIAPLPLIIGAGLLGVAVRFRPF